MDRLPPDQPLFAVCGAYDLLAAAEPDEVRRVVRSCLKRGVRFPIPPADIYPPGKPENIAAFVDEVRNGAP